MAEFRRLRTQADRATDDHVWRETAASRPGYATWPETPPGSPSWWLRHAIGVQTVDGRLYAPRDVTLVFPDIPPVDGETCKQWCGYCHTSRCGHRTPGLLVQPDMVCVQPAGHDGWHEDTTGTRWTPLEVEPQLRSAFDIQPLSDPSWVPSDPERVEEMRAAIVEAGETGRPVTLPNGDVITPRRRWWHRYTRRTR